MLPGKKVHISNMPSHAMLINPLTNHILQGISLSIEQYSALLKAVPAINAALHDRGYVVDEPDDADAPAPPVAKQSKTKTKPVKSNIDATSDEDSA